MSVARVHERGDRAAFHNIQAPTLQYKTLFTEIAGRKKEFIWPTREADKVEVVFEYGPTRHFYKNKNWRVLVALGSTFRCGIPPNGNRTFGAGVLRNEGTSAWNQRRLEKLGAWHLASSQRTCRGY